MAVTRRLGSTPLRLRRNTLVTLLIGALFAVVYVFYLNWQDKRAEVFLEDLRQKDPIRYLDDLRFSEGFDSFLVKYRTLEGYYAPRQEPPSFIVGRWTLFDASQRVPTGTVFDCRAPIVFERGQIDVVREGQHNRYETTYRISGKSVVAQGPEAGSVDISLMTNGATIDHLKLTPPGADTVQYAYRCGK